MAIRKRAVFPRFLLIILLSLLLPVEVVLAASHGQVFALRSGDAGGYGGSNAYLTHPNSSINTGWTDALTASTNWTSPPFIESGATQDCSLGCGNLYPYTSWADVNNTYHEVDDTPDLLAWDGWYQYYTSFTGNNYWQGVWCSGGGCRQIASADLGTSTAMNYVTSAIETSGTGIPMGGTVQTAQNQLYTPGNPWSGYCYNSTGINVAGSISACSNFAWNITW